MAHPDTRPISSTYAPVASMWVLALHYLLCNQIHPYPVTLLSTGSDHFWKKPSFPMNTLTFLKHSYSTPIHPWRWNRQSVLKCWHVKFRCRGITQKKAYNIQNMVKVWNEENFIFSLFSVRSAVINRMLTGNLCLCVLDCICKEFTYKNCSQLSLFGGFSMHEDLYG
jgi:hypothetical protein